MTRSMRVMFLALLAAMLGGYLQLKTKNDALAAAQPTAVTP